MDFDHSFQMFWFSAYSKYMTNNESESVVEISNWIMKMSMTLNK
jgi:hypothetical protein